MKKRLWVTTLFVAASLLSACATPAPETVVVKETVVVEGTPQIEERVVTATPEPTEEPEPETKTLVYVHPQEVRWLDPAQITESQSGAVVRNVYSRLLDQTYDASEIMPDLAEDWSVSDDGFVYTFYLQEGVEFHDGTPLTAEDVVYSFHRALAIDQGDTVHIRDVMDPDNVVALDATTVEVTLNEPWAPFLNIVAAPRVLSILPKAWVEANSTDDDPWAKEFVQTHANGTGPYRFVEWEPKQYVELERYEEYHKGPAEIETVLYRLGGEATTTRLALEKGDVDIAEHLPDDMMRVLSQNPDVNVLNKPVASYTYWIFNCKEEPFSDQRVREAIAYSIDYAAMMEDIVQESGVRMNSPLLNNMFAHNESIPLIERDVERAQQLLADAGYADGFTIDMPYVEWGLIPDLAVIIQANLADVGITAELREIPLNALMAGIEEDQFSFFVWNSSPGYPHPDAVLIKLISDNIGKGLEGNIANYENPEFDAAVEEARMATRQEDQLAAYYEAQERVMEDLPWLLLYQESQYRATRSGVTGYDFGAFNHTNFWDLDLNE